MAKEFDLGITDLQEIALKISQFSKASSRPRMVVITQGHDPVILVKGELSEVDVIVWVHSAFVTDSLLSLQVEF